MKCIGRALAITALSVGGMPQVLSAEVPSVVVSLKPVHSLVAGVMGNAGKPRLLLTGTESPHTYQMRPSDARALAEADLVVWVGESVETFLRRPVENLGSKAHVLTLHEASGIELLPSRRGGVWEENNHVEDMHTGEHDDHEHDRDEEDHANEDHDHGHDHGKFDMHIWLDPHNAHQIVERTAEALILLDPDRSKEWQENAASMHERIDDVNAYIHESLATARGQAFLVFHDAYQYFEHAYGLNGKGTIAIVPDRTPSAKRLTELRTALVKHDVRCVFTEPQFSPDLVHTVIQGSNARTAALDPIGIDAVPGPDAWAEVMVELADTMAACLGGN